VKLRFHLLVLTLVALVPMVAFAVIASLYLVQNEQETFRRGATQRTLALVTAVDAELKSSMRTLEALATDEALVAGDLRTFHRRAAQVLRSQPDWVTITVALPSGRQLLDAARPFGADVQTVQDRASFDHVVRTGAPAVGRLIQPEFTRRSVFPLRVVVVREGVTGYVLSAFLEPDSMATLLARQRIPSAWVAVLLDGERRIVARTMAPERTVGTLASESLRAALDRAPEGWFHGSTIEGARVYTPYNRSAFSGWTVAMGIPADAVEASASTMAKTMTAAVLAAILLAVALAIIWSRLIANPIAALVASARAVGRGDTLIIPGRSRIAEVGALAGTLGDAAALVRTREDALREADRRKDEFLATLSHELRTPLNAVYGWARMLRTGQIRHEAADRALDAIIRNAHAQVQLIDDLLDVSRVLAGKMRLEVQSVDLKTVIDAALDAVRPAAAAKGVRLQSVLDAGVIPMMGDPARLQQVVWNLLMNAVKFTPKGEHVQVHLLRVNSQVEIVVSDTGQGIAPEVLPFIFDRFRQGDSSSTRAHTGLGLGLALVRHLVELHGGTVVAHSAGEGKGATFIVKLPLSIAQMPAESEPRVHPTAAALPPPANAARLDGVSVLVVDDDQDALDLASAILKAAGAVVKTCSSARTALETLSSWGPDVLVSDIEMPEEDGYSLIRHVRALAAEDGGKTPAVALTAYGRVQDRVLSLSAGYNMHVPKPVDPGELTTIIASLAGRTSDPTEPAAER
jgi:signal transduction histidine kinase/ActR/RegA family two-component response regulator